MGCQKIHSICLYTDQQEYFEQLNRFLLLIGPIIEDLKRGKNSFKRFAETIESC
ncbi:hypothetical protein HDC90_003634 [Pedobacter sp. AK013]|nr:hypothetical protein [Pedobacter sp. AK013]